MWKANGKTTTLQLFLDSLSPKLWERLWTCRKTDQYLNLTVSAEEPTHPPVEFVPGALFSGCDADHSPPPTAEDVSVELYFHSTIFLLPWVVLN
jgi:hypothetical protein